MSLPRFLRSAFENYEVSDFREFLQERRLEVVLVPKAEKPILCHRCNTDLSRQPSRGKHALRLEAMPILGLRVYVYLWREKRHCPACRKVRSEAISFISPETPHLTEDYAWWIGRMCEIAPVSRVAEMMNQNETTTWRLDLARMKRMLTHYRIPTVTRISVDEVYARKKSKYPGESRDDRFFTVISDLKTHRVIWVAESRRKEALDQFFLLIGKEACSKIEVVASDQHEGYAASIHEHVPQAQHVWDRFHVMRVFEEAVNETRKDLHEEQAPGSEMKRLSRGKYRFLFVKKASRRSETEKTHIDEVLQANSEFARLELIKERMLTFFDQSDEAQAKRVFEEIGDWIWQCRFKPLMKWYQNFEKGWETMKNYFRHRVSSALSEGHNNVIKMLKRRAFGYRNMEYFRLKILQVCGYLNSRFLPVPALLSKQRHTQI